MRPAPMLLLAALVVVVTAPGLGLAIGLSAEMSTRPQVAFEYGPVDAASEESIARFHAFQDSVEFFKAVQMGDHPAALAALWRRTEPGRTQSLVRAEKSNALLSLAGAVLFTGLSLAIAADDQVDNLGDAIRVVDRLGGDTSDLEVSRAKWQYVRSTGVITALTGFIVTISWF